MMGISCSYSPNAQERRGIIRQRFIHPLELYLFIKNADYAMFLLTRCGCGVLAILWLLRVRLCFPSSCLFTKAAIHGITPALDPPFGAVPFHQERGLCDVPARQVRPWCPRHSVACFVCIYLLSRALTDAAPRQHFIHLLEYLFFKHGLCDVPRVALWFADLRQLQ